MGISVIGIPWYRPENYDQLRKLFIDGNKLHKTYDQWLASVEQLEKSLKDEGLFIFHAYIEPNTFPAWCLRQGNETRCQSPVVLCERSGIPSLLQG